MNLNNLLERNNNNLTFIRILLSIIVIYSHSFPLTGVGYEREFFVKTFKSVNGGELAVASFFFISGILITKSYLKNEKSIAFIISRLFRLLPALIISCIIIALIAGPLLSTYSFEQYFHNKSVYKFIYNNIIFHTYFNLPGVFENLYFPRSIVGSWWTLRYEFFCYTLLLAFGILGVFKHKGISLLFCFSIIYLTIVEPQFIKQFYSTPDVPAYIYFLPMYFSFGTFCFLMRNQIRINFKTVTAILVLTYLSKDTEIFIYLLLVSCFFLFLWISITPLIMQIKIRHDISYGIYIYGFFIQQFFVYFFPNMNHNFNALFSILVCIPIGLLSAIYVEEPSIKLGKKIIKKIYNI